MENDQLLQEVTAKAKVWLGEGYDSFLRMSSRKLSSGRMI